MSLIVIDTSVWARLRNPAIAAAVTEAIAANAVAMSEPLLLELLRSARDHKELLAFVKRRLHRFRLPEIAARSTCRPPGQARPSSYRFKIDLLLLP
jgi:predicted nucleic acid-binding protein